jgi:CheY-like chemotaxis protein
MQMTLPQAQADSPTPRRRILVVEDEDALRQELVELVGLIGGECAGAAGLTEALARIGAGPFDIILCDFNLGAESGLDLLRHVRLSASGSGPQPRLVLMTGHTELTDAAYEAIQRYADTLLLKPISIQALRALLDGAEGSPRHCEVA